MEPSQPTSAGEQLAFFSLQYFSAVGKSVPNLGKYSFLTQICDQSDCAHSHQQNISSNFFCSTSIRGTQLLKIAGIALRRTTNAETQYYGLVTICLLITATWPHTTTQMANSHNWQGTIGCRTQKNYTTTLEGESLNSPKTNH